MKERSTPGSGTYTPNMNMPSRSRKANRALPALLLTLILPPIGLIYLWREGVFRMKGRMLLTCIATIEMAIFFAIVMPADDLHMEAPMPVVPVAATIAPDDGVVTALSNIDQLLAQQQAERDAAAGVVTPEPTQDNAAYMAEQQAILDTTVYSVYGKGARYYHKDSVCGTQSNRRPLTVREAMGEGMGACAQCNPPVYLG